jgi:hypothetical protein
MKEGSIVHRQKAEKGKLIIYLTGKRICLYSLDEVHYLRYWHIQKDMKAYRSALFTLLAQTGHESL